MAGAFTQRIPFVAGVNHRTGGLSLRDRLFVEDAAQAGFVDRLRRAGIDAAVVISTCDRVEVVGFSERPDVDAGRVSETMARHAGLTDSDIQPALFTVAGAAAVRHLFRVAASLDSVVIGEPQVLGQLKACHRIAVDLGTVPAALDGLFQAAYGCAKRVRSETAIGERPVSIAAAAIGLAREIHGDLGAVSALLIGAGDMAELIVGEMRRAGLTKIAVVDPVPGRAGAVAAGLGAELVPMTELADALAVADVVVSALGGRDHHLSADMVRAGLKRRRYLPQFLIDAALPRDIDPAVDRIDDAFLYDVQDLERIALAGMASRESEAAKADAIVDAETANYLRAQSIRSAGPALKSLRQHVEQLRLQALRDAAGDAEKATHLLMARLLHEPAERLRVLAADGGDVATAERWLREIFGLADQNPEDQE